MNRRNVLAAGLFAPVVGLAGKGPYVTPEGYNPIEVFQKGEWVEYPFDDLVPGDIMRPKREPETICRVRTMPEKFKGIMGVIVDEVS